RARRALVDGEQVRLGHAPALLRWDHRTKPILARSAGEGNPFRADILSAPAPRPENVTYTSAGSVCPIPPNATAARVFRHGDGVPAVPPQLRAAPALPRVRRAPLLPGPPRPRARALVARRLAADALGADLHRPAGGPGALLRPAPPLRRGPAGHPV